MTAFIVLSLVALSGLVFILLIGRRRNTAHGVVDAPAPGSADAPLFAKPDKSKSATRR